MLVYPCFPYADFKAVGSGSCDLLMWEIVQLELSSSFPVYSPLGSFVNEKGLTAVSRGSTVAMLG